MLTDAKAARFVKGRLQEMHWLAAGANGTWVDIRPESDLYGWVRAGRSGDNWRVEADGTLIGVLPKNGDQMLLLLPVSFGTNYELEADIELRVDADVNPPIGGLVAGYESDNKHFLALVEQSRDTMLESVMFFSAYRGDNILNAPKIEPQVPPLMPRRFGLRVHGQSVTLAFPGTTQPDASRIAPKELSRAGLPGFYVGKCPSGMTMRVSNIRVRWWPGE